MDWTDKDWPDLSDAGKLVEIELRTGATFVGRLAVADFFPDSQGDEGPIFIVHSGNTRISFAANRRWRFMEERSS